VTTLASENSFCCAWEDTDDGKYGCEEEEVVGENRSKVEPFIAASWRHGGDEASTVCPSVDFEGSGSGQGSTEAFWERTLSTPTGSRHGSNGPPKSAVSHFSSTAVSRSSSHPW